MTNGTETKKPATLFSEYEPLRCKVCERDLLEDLYGVVAFVRRDADAGLYEDVYWACKGECDARLEEYHRRQRQGTGWEDIEDLANPLEFLRWNLAILNRIRDGRDVYSDEAFRNLKQFIIGMAQFAMREPTDEERERYAHLRDLPEGI